MKEYRFIWDHDGTEHVALHIEAEDVLPALLLVYDSFPDAIPSLLQGDYKMQRLSSSGNWRTFDPKIAELFNPKPVSIFKQRCRRSKIKS
jgi:hypothetical protein